MIFETSRLSVRNLRSSDFSAFHAMQSDDEVMRYTTGQGLGEAENRRQLQSCIDSYQKPGNEFWVWAITRKSDQAFLGTCAIVPSGGRPEIGFRLLRKFFGRGFGKEACLGLIQYAIEKQQVPELIARVDVRNLASVTILNASCLAFVEELANEDGAMDRFYRWTADTGAGKLGTIEPVQKNS